MYSDKLWLSERRLNVKDNSDWLEIETDLMLNVVVVLVGVEGENRDSSSKSLSIQRQLLFPLFTLITMFTGLGMRFLSNHADAALRGLG